MCIPDLYVTCTVYIMLAGCAICMICMTALLAHIVFRVGRKDPCDTALEQRAYHVDQYRVYHYCGHSTAAIWCVKRVLGVLPGNVLSGSFLTTRAKHADRQREPTAKKETAEKIQVE